MERGEKEALFYRKISEKIVQCQLCPHFCILHLGELGKCNVRKNFQGKLITLVYNKPCSIAIDPIEKKPLYHFLPGKKTLSIATRGCNLKCSFCQNHEISQSSTKDINLNVSYKEVIKKARKEKVKIISYTYTEPTIFYEYMLDIAKESNKNGLRNVIVTNGFINESPLKKLSKFLDASNIDLKSINEDFYENICSGKLQSVLNSIKLMHEEDIWIEITNLLIPGLNDSEEEIEKLAKWIKNNLGKDVPLHFSAFSPNYNMLNIPRTSEEKVKRAREIAIKQGIKFVYTGNINDDIGSTTYCFHCNKPLIIRKYPNIIENHIKDGKCPNCSAKIPGVWE